MAPPRLARFDHDPSATFHQLALSALGCSRAGAMAAARPMGMIRASTESTVM